MNELSRFWFLGVCCLLLLVSGCEMQPAPTPAVETTLPTAAPATATNPPTNGPPTATAVRTLSPTPTPTIPSVVPLHFDHLQDVLPVDEIDARLASWLFEPDVANALPLEVLADISAGGEAVITAEQAEEDISYLFALLKNGYAGYGFFNENGRFDRVQAQLKAAIEAQGQTQVSRVWLLQQIVTHLDFVQDCHFYIDIFSPCRQQYFWYVADWYFYEEDGRYFTEQEGERWWLTTVAGESPENVLKLTFDELGTPAYLLGQLANYQPEESLLTFDLPDGDSFEEMVEWETAVFAPPMITYETYRTNNGIPVVVSRLFPAEDEKLDQFVADAADLADEPIVVVDIRANGGGSSQWGEQWLENLTDVMPASPYFTVVLWTETALQGSLNGAIKDGYEGPVIDIFNNWLEQLQNEPGGWIKASLPTSVKIPNDDQLVVVLIDKGTASSGEWFVGSLLQLENVVLVGENTQGAGQFGEVANFVLPNSGLPVQFGTKLFLPPDLSFTEGIGYLPDVWVPTDQTLDKTLAAIEAGWLQPGP